MVVSSGNKATAAYLRDVIGGAATVHNYWDDARTSSVDVMQLDGGPDPRVSVAATLGLSDADIGLQVQDKPLRVELLISNWRNQEHGPNIVSTCAFNVINSRMKATPGTIHPRVCELYRPLSPMKHILLWDPYLWTLESQKYTDKIVAFLQLFPISDEEYRFALNEGCEALTELLQEHDVDDWNLDRKSVL